MKTSFFLTFLFASVVLGLGEKSGSGKTFYAKVNGQLQQLRRVKASGMDLIGLAWPDFPEVPLFLIEYGVVSTGEDQHTEFFGKLDGFLVLGHEDEVTPYRLHMDKDSRVLNLQISICDSPWGMLQPRDIHKEPEHKKPECEPYEIYFLSPSEAAKRAKEAEKNVEF